MKNVRTSVLQERLAKAAAYLERLDVERISHGDPNLGRSIEERIIWRELLDLELQDFDEEIERLSEVAHNRVTDAGTVTHACDEIEQSQRPVGPSPWWRLNRLFR
jgi:hypothetical protein